MAIIFKFMIKNILEKKLRSIMIIFSILVSSALFFSTIAISKNLEEMYLKQISKYFGSAEIMISQNDNSPSPFFSPKGAEKYDDSMEYIVGALKGTGFYKNENQSVKLDIQGVDLDDMEKMNPIVLAEKENTYPFNGKKIIISKKTAEKYGLKVGTTMELDIEGTYNKYFICGIAEPTGYFLEYGKEVCAVVPRDSMEGIYGIKGNVNVLYLKTKNIAQKDFFLRELSSEYSRYQVRETLTNSERSTFVNRISTSFRLMTIVVLFISMFIIYTSFRVISMERMPVIGTFRSIGATKSMTNMVLTSESILYGIIGGSLGSISGIGILKVMVFFITPSWLKEANQYIDMQFNAIHIIGGFLVGLSMSVISSIIPIIIASKYPIKDVVLNKIEKNVSYKSNRIWVGLLLWVGALIIPIFIPSSIAIIANTICAVMVIVGIILIIPKLTNMTIVMLQELYGVLFGNEGILSAKNLRNNKNMINTISLLSIGLSAFLMINTFSVSLIEAIADSFGIMDFQIQVSVENADRSFESTLRSIDGVLDTYGAYEAYSVKIDGKDEEISIIYGAKSDKFMDFFDLDLEGKGEEIVKKLDQGRNIIISSTLKIMMDYEVGDVITLETEKGKENYEIIGFFSTIGQEAFISEKYLKSDMNVKFFSQIYIKSSSDVEGVVERIKDKNQKRFPEVYTVEEMKQDTLSSNKQIMSAMQFFSIIALIIGAIGIANNFIVSFMERKQSFAVFRSIGMEKRQVLKMILLESMSGGIIGGVIGVIGGISLLWILPYIMIGMGLPISINYEFGMYLLYILAGILIAVVSSISPGLKTSKLNIIQAIKYE
ncbi:MAG: FtsX-like permease family protein [Clostridiaceae bacterium]|nr:FtsX-like permease family protein [Clostridiaceae bacterium]